MDLITWILIIGAILILPSVKYFKKNKIVHESKTWLGKIFDENIGRKIEIFGIVVSIIALIYSYQESKGSSELANKSFEIAKSTLEKSRSLDSLTKISLRKTDSIANATLALLDNISKSSNSLLSNITVVSEKILLIKDNLTVLATNLNSINKSSEDQLKNLSNINEVMHRIFNITNKQDSLKQLEGWKKPKIIVYLECNTEKKFYKIILKNIGETKCFVEYSLDWAGWQPIQQKEVYVNQEIVLQEFGEGFMTGDSVSAPINLSYKTNYEFYSTDSFKYIKCK